MAGAQDIWNTFLIPVVGLCCQSTLVVCLWIFDEALWLVVLFVIAHNKLVSLAMHIDNFYGRVLAQMLAQLGDVHIH